MIKKIFSIDHLFFVKQISENTENIFLKIIFNETNGPKFMIGNDKALGPDEFTAYFFKVAWHIVGKDVINAIMQFFSSSKLLPAFNIKTLYQ